MSESQTHAALVRLLDTFPDLGMNLLARLGMPLPAGARRLPMPTNVSVALDPNDTTLQPQALYTDNAQLYAMDEQWVGCVIFESQLEPSRQKLFRCLQYVGQILERLNVRQHLGRRFCPAKLVVLTPDDKTVRWGKAAFKRLEEAQQGFGQRFAFQPVFVGPKQLPITDDAVARADPALAALTAMVHPQSLQAAAVALRAAQTLDEAHQRVISELLFNCIAVRS